ncbi:hypothetical protein QT971_19655 [Microcoleus sp. herbarium19]|uniref:hypothetical protein n=1 Tax=unclassified Microcoleus TaxID=2642155 RepID=UPI002FD4B231
MKDVQSDEKLVSFLKQYRPNLPESAPDFEQNILAAIDRNEATASQLNYLAEPRFIESNKNSGIVGFRKWMFPAAIAAGLLVFGSGYRVLVTARSHADETAHLEAFLVNNWEGVLNDSHSEISPVSAANGEERSQTDLFNFAVNPDSEPLTNN